MCSIIQVKQAITDQLSERDFLSAYDLMEYEQQFMRNIHTRSSCGLLTSEIADYDNELFAYADELSNGDYLICIRHASYEHHDIVR